MPSSPTDIAKPATVLPQQQQDSNRDESLGIFADPQVLAQVKRIKSYATPERPKLPSDSSAWDMSWLHSIVWNSFKSMYYYADKILPDDYASYRDYALLTVEHLEAHHDAEEAFLFPTLEAKLPGSMTINEEQHASFLPRVERIKEYLDNAKEASKFDPREFRELVEPLVLPLFTHLADELPTLEGDKLRAMCTEEEIEAMSKACHPPNDADFKYRMLPFMLQSLPPTAPFPPVPRILKNVVFPWVFGRKHKNLWPYAAFPWTNKTGYTVPLE